MIGIAVVQIATGTIQTIGTTIMGFVLSNIHLFLGRSLGERISRRVPVVNPLELFLCREAKNKNNCCGVSTKVENPAAVLYIY